MCQASRESAILMASGGCICSLLLPLCEYKNNRMSIGFINLFRDITLSVTVHDTIFVKVINVPTKFSLKEETL
jgi:hypothetical protein